MFKYINHQLKIGGRKNASFTSEKFTMVLPSCGYHRSFLHLDVCCTGLLDGGGSRTFVAGNQTLENNPELFSRSKLMNEIVRKMVYGILIAAMAYVVVELLVNPGNLTSLLIGGGIGVGVTIFLIARSRGEKPEDVAKEVVQQVVAPDPGAKARLLNEQLTRLNEQIRMALLRMPIITPSEALIDLLREVVPHAWEKPPGTETTFDLEQLANTHLPKLLKEYSDLSSTDRKAQEGALAKQLQGLLDKVTKLKEHLDAGELHEFQVEHGFMNQKY